MPQDYGDSTEGPSGRKKKKHPETYSTRNAAVASEPVTDSVALATIQNHTTEQVPTLVKLALSGISDREKELIRASHLATRKYDITPQMVFGSSVDQMVSPITGLPLSLQEVRRLAGSRLGAAQIMRAVSGVVDERTQERKSLIGRGLTDDLNVALKDSAVNKMLDTIGKAFKDEHIPVWQGIGLAAELTGKVDPNRLGKNIAMVQRWLATGVRADWTQTLGIANMAAQQKIDFDSITDVVRFITPTEVSEALKKEAASTVTPEEAKAALFPGVDPEDPRLANIGGRQEVLNDYMRNFTGDIDSGIKRAEALKDKLVLEQEAWDNSWFNKYVVGGTMSVLDKANRAFEITAITAKELAEDIPGPTSAIIKYNTAALGVFHGEAAGIALDRAIANDPTANLSENLEQFKTDLAGAWQGKTRLADTIQRDWGLGRWQAEAVEFIAGWYLDPLIIAGKAGRAFSVRNINPDVLTKLRVGESSVNRLAKYTARAEAFTESNLTAFTKAMNAEDTIDLVKMANRWRQGVMGSTPFDVTFLETVRNEMKARGILGKATEDDMRQVLKSHFWPTKPEAGSLLDTSFAARQADKLDAFRAFRENPFDIKKSQEVAERETAVLADEALDPTNFMPRRFELPGKRRPIPGMGFVPTVGDFVGDVFPDFIGRNLRKLPNINPGGILKLHQDPAQWFQRSARRAGWSDAEVTRWETRAVEAAASPAPEQTFKGLLKEFEEETMFKYSRPSGISDDTAKSLLKELAEGGKKGKGAPAAPIFGVRNEPRFLDDGTMVFSKEETPRGVTETIGQTELTNFLPAVDPIQMRHAVSEYTGMVRKMRNATIRAFKGAEGVPVQTKAAIEKLTLAFWANSAVDYIGKPMVKIFKLGAVARPAYTFRVVLGDELLRAMATNQSVMEQALSYGWWTKSLRAIPDDAGTLKSAARSLGSRVDQLGTRQVGGRFYERPGALFDEPLANTQLDVGELATATMTTTDRKLAKLKASGDYAIKAPNETGHLRDWAHALNQTMRKAPMLDEGMRVVAEGSAKSRQAVQDHLKQWVQTPAGKAELRRLGVEPYEAEIWAERAGDMAYGYTMGQPEVARLARLGEIDEKLLASKFSEKIKIGNREVWGRPYVHGPKLAGFKERPVNWAADKWYGAWVRQPENHLNRQPYYHQFKQRGQAAMERMLDSEGIAITDDVKTAIDQASREFALNNSKKIMFDFTENSRLGELLSFAFPFIQPWQENISVWGHILTRRNPAMVGYVNRVAQAGVQSGFISKDENGQWTIPETWFGFTMPFLWMVGGHPASDIGPQGEDDSGSTINLPFFGKASNAFSLSTGLTFLNLFANSTFPVRGVPVPAPGLGPWAAWPLQKFFQEKDYGPGMEQYLFGFGPGEETVTGAAIDMLIPRWIRQASNAIPGLRDVIGDPDQIDKIAGDYMELQQRMGQKVDPERAQNQAEMTAAYLGFTAAFFPGAVHIEYPDDYLNREYHQLVDDNNGDPSKAQEVFLKKYPEYDMITIPKTVTTRITNNLGAKGEELLNLFEENLQAPPGVRPASTKYYEAILKQPGFKEFANNPETAMWAMVLMFNSDNPKADEFDIGAYMQQIGRGDVRRRTAAEVYTDHETYEFFEGDVGWTRIDEQYDARFKKIEKQGGYAGDNGPWDALANEKALELGSLLENYPVTAAKYFKPRDNGYGYVPIYDNADQYPEGVHPAILRSAALVLQSPLVEDFPAVKGLRLYMQYRSGLRDTLEAKGLDGLEDTRAGKFKDQYAAQVNNIIGLYPEFEKFYNTWFQNDMRYGLPTEGERTVLTWQQESLAERRSETATARGVASGLKFDQYSAFRDQYNDFRVRLKSSFGGSKFVPGEIYQQRTELENRWFSQNPEIVKTYLNSRTAAQRQEDKAQLATAPPAFYSRIDWLDAGVKLSNKAAGWIEKMQATNTAISAWDEKMDLTRSTGDKRADLAKFIDNHLGKDKTFDQAIDAMNTWGWGATVRKYDKGPGKSARAWRAIIEYANSWKDLAEEADIHGDAKTSYNLDPEDRSWYNNGRDNIMNYVDSLKDWSPAFKKQWNEMANDYGDELGKWIMPEIWFKTGDTSPFGTDVGKAAGKAHLGGAKLASDRGVTLQPKALESLETAQKRLKLPVMGAVDSSYRYYKEQAGLYARRGSNPNPVASPGTSNHERGFAVDFNSDFLHSHPDFIRWLLSNGWAHPYDNDYPHWEYNG